MNEPVPEVWKANAEAPRRVGLTVPGRLVEWQWMSDLAAASPAPQRILNAPRTIEDLELLQARLAHEILQHLRVESVSLFLFDGRRSEIVCRGVAGIDDPDDLSREAHQYVDPSESLPEDADPVTRSLHAGRVQIYAQAEGFDPRVAESLRRRVRSRTIASSALIPFSFDYECAGVCRLVNRYDDKGKLIPGGFLPSDVPDLESLAGAVGERAMRIRHDLTVTAHSVGTARAAAQGEAAEAAVNIAAAAVSVGNAYCAAVYVVSDADKDLGERGTVHLLGHSGFSRSYPELSRFPIEGSVAGRVALGHGAKYFRDYSRSPGVSNRAVAESEQLRAALVLPLGPLTRGALAVFSRAPRAFSAGTVGLLERLARHGGAILRAIALANQEKAIADQRVVLAHSLKEPLTSIRSSLRDIGLDVADPESVARIKAIDNEIDVLVKRADGLLLASPGILALMGLKRGQVKLQILVTNSVNRLHRFADDKKITVTVAPNVGRLPDVAGDSDKLELVVENLLHNAIKYSREGTAVEIRGEHQGANVVLEVENRGLHIPVSVDVFQGQTRSSLPHLQIPGTGMGLFIVRTIVEAHKGKVTFVSRPPDDRRDHHTPLRDNFRNIFTVRIPLD